MKLGWLCAISSCLVALAGCDGQDQANVSSSSTAGLSSKDPAAADGKKSGADSRREPLAIRRRDDHSYSIDDVVLVHLAIDAIDGNVPVTALETGYRLDRVPPESLLAQLGLQQGDVIISLNEVLLKDTASLKKAYEAGRAKRHLRLFGKRGDQQLSIEYRITSLRPTPRRSTRSHGRVIEVLRQGVKATAPDRYELDRAVLRAFGEHPSVLRHRRHLTASLGDPGVRLSFLDETGYRALSLFGGDIVHEVNGQVVSEPDQLHKIWATLTDADELTIAVTRDGKRRQLHYRVVTGMLDEAALKLALEKMSSATRNARPRPNQKIDAELAAAVVQKSDGVFEVDREKFAPHLKLSSLKWAARYVPEKQAGKIIGFRLFAVRFGSVLRVLGFRSGDRVTRINGYPLDTLDRPKELYTKFRTAPRITVQITRRTETKTLIYIWR